MIETLCPLRLVHVYAAFGIAPCGAARKPGFAGLDESHIAPPKRGAEQEGGPARGTWPPAQPPPEE